MRSKASISSLPWGMKPPIWVIKPSVIAKSDTKVLPPDPSTICPFLITISGFGSMAIPIKIHSLK